MAKLSIFKKLKPEIDYTNDIIIKIQDGDKLLKERFISDYTPFILKTVARITNKYVDVQNSEEYSIALMAFDEAINCFNIDKNKSFLAFSDLVINRRLIDYIRKNRKDNNVFPFTYFDCESYEELKEKYLLEYSVTRLDNIEIKEEIILFKEKLATFGITLENLAKSIPKHKDSKLMCIRIARIIASDKELNYKLNKTKNIPMTDLMKLVDVHHATIERNRKFIIAVSLVINSGLDVIKSYLQFTEEGGVSGD
ncbi:RNA polymerase sigma-I factor [Pseudobacteroides cellulosolvens]|uniref:RNA polymerase sigma factor SigI n=1 Tax=Pseudobacteroides cellulosolvens ATCC 35603 = DSM 2933 TaxID=398512 RepID=A0A0L6JIB3_9FIRM|nr:RNA polymerase sigma-I factor [Pseudobacteroides cellulosolvens]KNY25465.1 RNA polymerase, sigma 28 subunit, SigI [Pseudobacteroides cellulosolvens ATCC 35603 = DSM 2933]